MTVIMEENKYFEGDHFIHLKMEGKLTAADYDKFVPDIEQKIQAYGKINMLLELTALSGWTVGAVWEDTKFGVCHFNHFKYVAVVGSSTSKKIMSYFCKIFMTAQVRYFKETQRHEAIKWLQEK